ncbi:CLAVATA3/ESR (CLE)-related protein 46-like isoform X2 [Hibiscus syriacus]|uniref:CLAVATA3/ESR (CLE)-related protein 46-like isoform X2 n=1 Tax=Hibiscus syriacus TaxID=106335 RepID=UPI001922372D|nr:CLAVATA3/ESR (CLE)-related protein 46-like isoform X2 [Hibiscus syriacus]
MRGQVLTYILLLAWFLLIDSQLQGSQIDAQAIESVHFKFRPRSLMSRLHARNALPTWVEMKKIHKSPSGQNPLENHKPPSRH